MKQKDIVKKIRKLGYKVTVLNASISNRGGIPDCMISHEGNAIFVEIKIDKDKLSKLQSEFINEFYEVTFVLWYNSENKTYHLINERKKSKKDILFDFVNELTQKLNNVK